MKEFEQTVEKILRLIDQIRVEQKAHTLNRKKPVAPCEIIDETVDDPKPRGCVFCIPTLPRGGRATTCGCQIIERKK